MNEGVAAPPRLCCICGERELVECRVKDRSFSPLMRAWPHKAIKAYEANKPDHYFTIFDDRNWKRGMPKTLGWGIFLNRIDPDFIGPFCCGDCVLSNENQCIAILGGKPTTEDKMLGTMEEYR